jgi:hypothetical protein
MKRDIEAAHKKLTDRVIALPRVSGTAIGIHHGKPCLKVFVSGEDPSHKRRIPSVLQGFRVVVEKRGPFEAL